MYEDLKSFLMRAIENRTPESLVDSLTKSAQVFSVEALKRRLAADVVKSKRSSSSN
jgi:hypothetical protein